MPITLKTSNVVATEWKRPQIASSLALLQETGQLKYTDVEFIKQTSFSEKVLSTEHIVPQVNGLVHAAYSAYTYHHHLVIRPEDVWFAVLSQFSFYVNKHAEDLRGSFVSHEGKKGLILRQEFDDIGSIDFGTMCRNMTDLIDRNIVDPKLRSWVLPSFTTTTLVDETVAAILMMSTLQRYFDYVFDPTTCAIPTVTLLGEREDYEDILGRLDKLTEYGEEPTWFAERLRPVLRGLVASFEVDDVAAPNPEVVDFWSRIVHYMSGSGADTLSGWITAFCLWDEKGELLVPKPSSCAQSKSMAASLPPFLHLDGVLYDEIEMQKIPAGYGTVPVTVMGDQSAPVEMQLLAGSVGFKATSRLKLPKTEKRTSNEGDSTSTKRSNAKTLAKRLFRFRSEEKKIPIIYPVVKPSMGEAGKHVGTTQDTTSEKNTLQPVSGWWMYKKAGSKTYSSKVDFLTEKKAEWKGGVSVLTIDGQGRVAKVASNLGDYGIRD
ncbi:hypothetical protein BX600DRAFT_507504 [Xylariales sp. PMI_506]|nr:hypothetical protein BX600DRAFT_507504 [Xylariales sp. PMI_506]